MIFFCTLKVFWVFEFCVIGALTNEFQNQPRYEYFWKIMLNFKNSVRFVSKFFQFAENWKDAIELLYQTQPSLKVS